MADDAAMKQRIITHMNGDHHDSIVRYLEHYQKLSAWTAYSGRITDISLDTVTLRSDAGTHRIPFKPPMKSLREGRERLVAMDKESVQALGRSDISVKWTPPGGRDLVVLAVLAAFFIVMSHDGHFTADGTVGRFLPEALRLFMLKTRAWTFWGLVGIHVAEAYFLMGRKRLDKYNVNVRSSGYWMWTVESLIGGIGALKRFDLLVAQKKKEKAQQKH